MTIQERYSTTIEYFTGKYPLPETELLYSTPFGLIVAVILSAQCTDKRVNIITPALLGNYPDANTMSKAEPAEILEYIKSCSYPNNKAKHLSGMSRMLISEFGGTVPSDPLLLQKLPGVGRKTANVVASVLFNKPVMAVDTHVFRVSARIGLVTNAKTPLATELQLTRYLPENVIHNAHHWLILHGRYVCKARKPLCSECGLTNVCKFFTRESKLIKKTSTNHKIQRL
jgi:endonuclease III